MKWKSFITIVVLLACAGNAQAVFSTAPGYSAVELYDTDGSFTTCNGLDLDAGILYFGQSADVMSLDMNNSNTVSTLTSVSSATGVSSVVRKAGTTYMAFGTSFDSPYPYKMGYIDSNGDYFNQLDEDGIYDRAVNSNGDCYIVANPSSAGSRIFSYDWNNGNITEIANIGGYSGGLAFDSHDNLYYAEQTNGQVLKFTPAQVAAGGLNASDADIALNVAAGFLQFDADDNLLATTGWGSTLSIFDLDTQTKINDIAYGGIGQIILDGDALYTIDTDWDAYASTVQQITVPEPATLGIMLIGGISILRRRKYNSR